MVKDGVALRKEVETGISDNSNIQISSGIDVGERIVTGSYRTLSRTLKDNDTVVIAEQQEGENE